MVKQFKSLDLESEPETSQLEIMEIDNKILVEKKQEMHYFAFSNSLHGHCLFFSLIFHLAWSNA